MLAPPTRPCEGLGAVGCRPAIDSVARVVGEQIKFGRAALAALRDEGRYVALDLPSDPPGATVDAGNAVDHHSDEERREERIQSRPHILEIGEGGSRHRPPRPGIGFRT